MDHKNAAVHISRSRTDTRSGQEKMCIRDSFCGEGITQTYHSDSSVHGMQQTIDICKKDFHGLCFVNLVDFDSLWGYRRNP